MQNMGKPPHCDLLTCFKRGCFVSTLRQKSLETMRAPTSKHRLRLLRPNGGRRSRRHNRSLRSFIIKNTDNLSFKSRARAPARKYCGLPQVFPQRTASARATLHMFLVSAQSKMMLQHMMIHLGRSQSIQRLLHNLAQSWMYMHSLHYRHCILLRSIHQIDHFL